MNERNKSVRISFGFICEPTREAEARQVLANIPGVEILEVVENERRGIRSISSRVIYAQEGLGFKGRCNLGDLDRLIKELAKPKIAGYSRATQILFD